MCSFSKKKKDTVRRNCPTEESFFLHPSHLPASHPIQIRMAVALYQPFPLDLRCDKSFPDKDSTEWISDGPWFNKKKTQKDLRLPATKCEKAKDQATGTHVKCENLHKSNKLLKSNVLKKKTTIPHQTKIFLSSGRAAQKAQHNNNKPSREQFYLDREKEKLFALSDLFFPLLLLPLLPPACLLGPPHTRKGEKEGGKKRAEKKKAGICIQIEEAPFFLGGGGEMVALGYFFFFFFFFTARDGISRDDPPPLFLLSGFFFCQFLAPLKPNEALPFLFPSVAPS